MTNHELNQFWDMHPLTPVAVAGPWPPAGAEFCRPDHLVQPKPDAVNHPSHYTQGGIECIDAIESALTPAEFAGYLRGNIIKYAWRMGRKDAAAQEAGKLVWYGERLKSTLSKAAK